MCSTMKVVGLMSGTAADGIDAALVEIEDRDSGLKAETLAFGNYHYPERVREKIFELFSPKTSSADRICRFNFVLGRLFADAAVSVIEQAGLELGDVDLVAMHGQTVCHLPWAGEGEFQVPSTLQIGEPAVVAERTGITVISNFRSRDIAAGGQGAPLVPYADYILFRHEDKTRVVQNIGGIANMTVLPRGARPQDVIAFDNGPGNMVIDAVVSEVTGGCMDYDVDGAIAARGRVVEEFVAELMDHPFVRIEPPKSTGREEFGAEYVKSVMARARTLGIGDEDIVASVTAFTAECIGKHLSDLVVPEYGLDELIIGGGGAYNPTLMRMIRERVDPVPVVTHEAYGISSDAKEAIAFAILGYLGIHGIPANLPSATGAHHQVLLGAITPGRWSEKVWDRL